MSWVSRQGEDDLHAAFSVFMDYDLPMWSMSAALNAVYAKRHGYAYAFYLYACHTNKKACSHPKNGPVISNWCRLPALFDAFERFTTSHYFLYLDNDALVRNMRLPLKPWLAHARLSNHWATVEADKCKALPSTRALDADANGVQPSIWAWANTHWGCSATTGTFIVRRSEASLRLLNLWWAAAGIEECGQPFDQGPFVCRVVQNKTEAAHVKVLAEDSFADDPANYVLHRCFACNFLPEYRSLVEQTIVEHNVTISELRHALKSIWSDREMSHQGGGCASKSGAACA